MPGALGTCLHPDPSHRAEMPASSEASMGSMNGLEQPEGSSAILSLIACLCRGRHPVGE
jgi:hypothetical protein